MEIEAKWGSAKKTRACIALALEADTDNEVKRWLRFREGYFSTLRICNAGSHQGTDVVPDSGTVDDLRKMVDHLLAT